MKVGSSRMKLPSILQHLIQDLLPFWGSTVSETMLESPKFTLGITEEAQQYFSGLWKRSFALNRIKIRKKFRRVSFIVAGSLERVAQKQRQDGFFFFFFWNRGYPSQMW